MVYRLALHPDAREDLEQLRRVTPTVATKIIALMQEIKGDQQLLDRLTDDGFGADRSERFDVSKWAYYFDRGLNLWRLKLWELERVRLRYRVVYAYEIRSRTYYVLAIVPRDFNYDPAHPTTQRILDAYHSL